MKWTLVALALASLAACQKQPEPGASTASATAKPAPVAASAPVPAQHSGPFGLAGGISVAEVERLGFKAAGPTPGVFTGTPPKPLQGFGTYLLVAVPDVGLCRIRADADISVVNGSGDQLKAKADQLAETMAMKYGQHSRKIDYIDKDVYVRNPQYWMVGLQEQSVFYAYTWSAGKTAQPLPDDIEGIEISTSAESTSSGTVGIVYTYKNMDQCRSVMKKHQAANL